MAVEENLRKHKSSVSTVEVDLESQGVQGYMALGGRDKEFYHF
jgi:hypothetical protein